MALVKQSKHDVMPQICRNCLAFDKEIAKDQNCRLCGSYRIIAHPSLDQLSIAHLDCDSFFASVEKRDNPKLKNKPVIVGGGKRGVVAACCYISRINGIHSAMPMFKALELCPNAIVIHPNIDKYQETSNQIKEVMLSTTPIVESLSIDEAFLDLSGTQKLHGSCPAVTLVKLSNLIEDKIGITVSIGLSFNKFLAKMASDLDKPRGFSIIGENETLDFLENRSIDSIWGVGKSLQLKLKSEGIVTIGQLRKLEKKTLYKKYGKIGLRLSELSNGIDERKVEPKVKRKSVSVEKTFQQDTGKRDELLKILWPLCERISKTLKKKNFKAKNLTLKLKRKDFKIKTSSRTYKKPKYLAEEIYQEIKILLDKETHETSYRLIGINASKLEPNCDEEQSVLPLETNEKIEIIEKTIDLVRQKYGEDSIKKGRSIKKIGNNKF
tara:strand:+ start:2286 stop:3599 length:1314 start_codon:yes stop_codon:yes gene_type:complete